MLTSMPALFATSPPRGGLYTSCVYGVRGVLTRSVVYATFTDQYRTSW
jgi:hypothetical protein